MLIDDDWCWLILIDADWSWLMLTDADRCSNKVQPGFLFRSVPLFCVFVVWCIGGYLGLFMMSGLCLVSLISRNYIKIVEIPLIPDPYYLKGFNLHVCNATPTKSITTQQFHIYRFIVQSILFVSSDRSSYSDDGLLYIRGSGSAHFFRFLAFMPFYTVTSVTLSR